MNRKLRKALEREFTPPEPSGKAEFIRTVKKDGISGAEFAFMQMFYIRKSVWLLSLAVLGFAAYVFVSADRAGLWAASALTPWLAATVAAESSRSTAYGMAELEASTRFSLLSLTVARLGILGAVHFVLLCLLTVVCGGFSTVRNGIYLLTPYILTLDLSLPLTRKIGGSTPCLGAAALVGGAGLLARGGLLYRPEMLGYWGLALTLLALALCPEIRKLLKGCVQLGA